MLMLNELLLIKTYDAWLPSMLSYELDLNLSLSYLRHGPKYLYGSFV